MGQQEHAHIILSLKFPHCCTSLQTDDRTSEEMHMYGSNVNVKDRWSPLCLHMLVIMIPVCSILGKIAAIHAGKP